jgi:hypothetical protein
MPDGFQGYEDQDLKYHALEYLIEVHEAEISFSIYELC